MASSPNSSVKSSSTTIEDEEEDTNTFCHTPCRRDTNCTCKICQASINATLDLLPFSAQRSSLSKISSSKPSPPETPPFFHPSTVSTPLSHTPKITTHFNFNLNTNNNNTGFGYLFFRIKWGVFLLLCLSMVGKFGFEFKFVSSSVMTTKFSPDIVTKLGEKSLGFEVLKYKLVFLNHELQSVVGAIERSSKIPNWEIVQDGFILRSRCRLYKSGMEEVSVWGWPLQTSGKVSTDFGSRSFTVLSGRVTEVSNGLIRTANSSWELGKGSASVWRLDENTWILEYERSFVFEDAKPFLSVMEFLRFKMMRSFEWMKKLWTFSDGNHLAPT